MKISVVDFWYGMLTVITSIASIIVVLAIGFTIHSCLFDPTLQFKCQVYHIYGKSEIKYLIQKTAPFQPRWSRDQGWINDFCDPTICRFEIIQIDTVKTDTIKNYDRKRSY